MEDKKYEFTGKIKNYDNKVLHQIRALKDFGSVRKNSIGGWIESEKNLSQEGFCWVSDDAMVFDNAFIFESAVIKDNAIVKDNSLIYGNAEIRNNSIITDNSKITGFTTIQNNAKIKGSSYLSGFSDIKDNVEIINSVISQSPKLYGNVKIKDSVISGYYISIGVDFIIKNSILFTNKNIGIMENIIDKNI